MFFGGDTMEKWKQIKKLHYSISNLGNVRNDKTNHILKPQKNIYGYNVILLYDNGKPLHCQIHRLVLEAFNPVENIENLQVNHIDCNRSNNNLNNLEWTTPSENCLKKASKQKFYNSKGCYDNFGNYFNSYREAGRYYNISANTVKNDCLRNNKTPRNLSRAKTSSNFSQIGKNLFVFLLFDKLHKLLILRKVKIHLQSYFIVFMCLFHSRIDFTSFLY